MFWATPIFASTSEVCDQVAHIAAAEAAMPVSVLQAITRTETGRRRAGTTQPWPWTVNMEGEGRWFDTREEALSYVIEHFERGARSFDVGCFQINYRWHGQHFSTIDQMFDPLENARYAARFLGELYAEKGDWSDAAGAFHSRTPRYANRYIRRFDAFRAALGDGVPVLAASYTAATTVAEPAPATIVRVNRFPLLQSVGAPRGNGSLVMLAGRGNGRRFIAGSD